MTTERWFPDAMPTPGVSLDTRPWWDALAEHRLTVQRCPSCGDRRLPPSPVCPECSSTEVAWEDVAARGSVYTFTIVRQPFLPGTEEAVPYVVAAVELDDAPGVRIFTNVVGDGALDVEIGEPVEIVFEDMGPGYAVPRAKRLPVSR